MDFCGSQELTLEQRLWSKVTKSDDGCWNWTAAKDKRGYGRLNLGQKKGIILAHRLSWILAFGDIPDGICVLHACDNPSCQRPDHLFLGTIADNIADMDAKGRRVTVSNPSYAPKVWGSKHHRATITESDVVEIRRLYSEGETVSALTKTYGMSRGNMQRLLRGKNWKHVPGVPEIRDFRHLVQGSANVHSRLSPEQVQEIRRRCANGDDKKAMAKDFGVCYQSILDIHNRRTWKHIT